MTYTAKIEQTSAYRKRIHYMPNTDTFEEKDCDSLSWERNVPQPSGWIKESGTPPCEHLDVIVMTDLPCELGDEIPVRVIGVFCRWVGDNKLVAVPESRRENERILIVSHGTALSFLQSMLMGYELEDISGFRFKGRSGSISKFVIEPGGKRIAHYINHRIF